jgi:hypothetical protein
MPAIECARIIPDRRTPYAKTTTYRRVAITLVELTVALALAAIVIIVALRATAMARENQRVHELSQELAVVFSAVMDRYPAGSDMSTLDSPIIQGSMTAVQSAPLSSQDGYASPYDLVGVWGDSQQQWEIDADALSAQACASLATKFNDQALLTGVMITAGSFSVSNGGPAQAMADRPTATGAATVCNAMSNNITVAWIFGTPTAQSGFPHCSPTSGGSEAQTGSPLCQ